MVALLSTCLGLGVLYFWLLGHWFARILAFLIFAALFGMIGGSLCAHIDSDISATVASAPPPAPLPGSRLYDAAHMTMEDFTKQYGPMTHEDFLAQIGAVAPAKKPEPRPAFPIVGFILGAALAWPVSGLPVYYHRRQVR
jgi:hypothetical protein